MRVAVVYTGLSLSQPVLLNELVRREDASLHLFRDTTEDHPPVEAVEQRHVETARTIAPMGVYPLWVNQLLIRRQWRQLLRERLDESFDLIIGMNDVGPPAVAVANELNVPSLFFVRNLEVTGQELYDPDRNCIDNVRAADMGGRVQYPFLARNFQAFRAAFKNSTLPIANSEYVAGRFSSDFGVKATVIYPPIQLSEYDINHNDDGYIGMVNPRNRDKGADIFLDIVESMPSEEFLSAGVVRSSEFEDRAASLDNLTHLGWCDDMREFYRQVKLVLVPSRWNEAFGRVAAECMAAGIPCVVSDRGGLPEVVGDTGVIVEQIESVQAWRRGIDSALATHDPVAQRRRATKFSADRQGEKFAEVVSSVT